MKRAFGYAVQTGLFLAVALGHDGAQASNRSMSALTVAIHDYAGVSPETLIGARETTSRVFGKAGVTLEWIDPLRGTASIHVHLLSATMTARAQAGATVLGLTSVGSGMVYVLFPRVAETSSRLRLYLPRLLGYVIAHEIGHLLLPGRGHAEVGLMGADLNVRLAALGILAFTAPDVTSMKGSDLLRSDADEDVTRPSR